MTSAVTWNSPPQAPVGRFTNLTTNMHVTCKYPKQASVKARPRNRNASARGQAIELEWGEWNRTCGTFDLALDRWTNEGGAVPRISTAYHDKTQDSRREV